MWASADDIEALWLSGDLPDRSQIVAWLELAETVVRHEFPDIDDRLVEEVNLAANLRYVVSQMVIRKLQNPEGVRTRQGGIESYSESMSFDASTQGWMLPEERAMLAGIRSGQRAFTVDMTPVTSPTHPLFGAVVNAD